MADRDPPNLPATLPAAPSPAAPYRSRHDGWTEPRKRTFLHALARTGCVRDACGMRAG